MRGKHSRKHKILDHPVLSLFLLPVVALAIITCFSFLSGFLIRYLAVGELYAYVAEILISFLVLLIFRIWIKPFKGMLGVKHLLHGLIMLLPVTAVVLINLYQPMQEQKLTIQTVLMGFAPGVLEEVVFRGIPLSNYMRCMPQKNEIRKGVWISGIVFGLMHATNVFLGANGFATAMQVLYATGFGILFGAVFIRTGTLLPCIIAHSLVDITAFTLVDLVENGGMLTEASVGSIVTVIIGAVYLAFGLWLLRDEKLQDTVQIWQGLFPDQIHEEIESTELLDTIGNAC